MPRASHARIESPSEYEQGPQVALGLDLAEDPSQLIAILEDQRIRFFHFKASIRELNEIQVDPNIDSHDRVLDAIAPATVDELRGRTRNAVQMVLLVNSVDMPEGVSQIALDCIKEIKEFNGRVIAYGGGNLRESAIRAWLKADQRYSVAGTNVMARDERQATQVFDDLDSIRAHFSETTGWIASENQHEPIEDFWEGVSRILEEEQRRKTWGEVMTQFQAWLEQTDKDLLYELVDWKRGTRQNPHSEAMFFERSRRVSDTLAVHIFEGMADIDKGFYDELRALILKEKRPKEAVDRLMRKTLDMLASSHTSAIFNEALLSQLRQLLADEEPSASSMASGMNIASHGEHPMEPSTGPSVFHRSTAGPTPGRRPVSSSRSRVGRLALVAAAFLAAPVATFHGLFGLNKNGIQEFASVIVDSAQHHEPSNPFPFLKSRSTEPSNPPQALVSETSSVVTKWTTPCSTNEDGLLHVTDTSSSPVYIARMDGSLISYPPCRR